MPSLASAFSVMDKKTIETVPSVNLQRYAGKWYEVARYPNRFQKQCAGNVTAEYKLLENGGIEVVNTCTKADGAVDVAKGKARVKDTQTNAKLEVRFAPAFLSFLPFVWGSYWIVELEPDYQYAVVSEPNDDYLWILSRTPQMDETLYKQIIERLKSKGFDTNKIVKTKQD
jgi:apolipoprotein D and lipocalin family protein